jgi:hypothetical protein
MNKQTKMYNQSCLWQLALNVIRYLSALHPTLKTIQRQNAEVHSQPAYKAQEQLPDNAEVNMHQI